LGLAQDLADLNVPQMIVMREPVPDKVAQEFLKYFLASSSRGQSFYLAVKEARERLQGLESQFPCASWLPVICQSHPEKNNLFPNIPNRLKASKTQKLIALGLCIFSISVYAIWQDYIQKMASESLLAETESQKTDPKNTIIQYYKLATTNRKAALQLVSDSFRQEKVKVSDYSWWESMSKIEVYKFIVLDNSQSNATIQIWLKYYMASGETVCESSIVRLVLDNKNTWLINTVSNVEQKPFCDNS